MPFEVKLKFANKEQKNVFKSWFEKYGFDEMCQSDMVHDELPDESFFEDLEIKGDIIKIS